MSAFEEIINPPPEILPIVETTASYVARKGARFETQIMARQITNKKFDFMKPTSPYHAFYRKMISDIKANEGHVEETEETKKEEEEELAKKAEIERKQLEEEKKRKTLLEEIMDDLQEYKKPKKDWIKGPITDKHTVTLPENIVAVDVDVIKLTAQFVAKNGRRFLAALTNRELHNSQFDFLKTFHPLFPYFEQLVAAYTAVIIPSTDLLTEIKNHHDDTQLIKDQLFGRVEWERLEKKRREEKKDNAEADRVAMALIDWHDFVVLETIDFNPEDGEYLPAPAMNFKEINAILDAEKNLQQLSDIAVNDDMEVSDESEEEFEDEDLEEKEPELPEPVAPRQKIEKIDSHVPALETISERERRSQQQSQRKLGSRSSMDYTKCSICGEHILTSELEEHMRIELLDPKWKDQKKREKDKTRESSLASPLEMGANLRRFVQIRKKAFQPETETDDKKQEGDSRIIWDGHSDSIRSVTTMIANKAMAERKAEMEGGSQRVPITKEALASKQPPPSRKTVVPPQARPKPVVPPPRPPTFIRPFAVPPMGMPPRMAFTPMQPQIVRPPIVQRPMQPAPPSGPRPSMQMPMQRMAPVLHPPPPMTGQPPAKRLRPDQPQPPTSLIPEDEFMRTHPPNVKVRVIVPRDPSRSEWNFQGQTLHMDMQITNTVTDLKNVIAERLGGIPIKKQKLRMGNGIFVKDSQTLAFYNTSNNSLFELGVKGRGGRTRK